MYKLGIVIPCYNEFENIIPLLEILKAEMKKNSISTKILVVDDSSPDGTGNLVENFIKVENTDDFCVELISRKSKSGLASAYIQGLSSLKPDCDYLLEMDADHSHRPIYIPQMIAEIEKNNFDYVIGSRNIVGGSVENWGLHRKLISRLGAAYCRFVLKVNIKDFTGGFNMYKSKVFDVVKLNEIKAEGYLFQIELKYKAYKSGFKFKEIPIVFPDRREGKSKFSKSIILEAFLNIWSIK